METCLDMSPCRDILAKRELRCLAKMSSRHVATCLGHVCDATSPGQKFECLRLDICNLGVFTAALFKEACDEDGQSQRFSGVGAQHQNSEAERSIQTVACMARYFIIHAALNWGQHGANDLKLWSLALDRAGWFYNRIPQRRSGITPLEFVTKDKANHVNLARTHVWGCPCYVFDAKL